MLENAPIILAPVITHSDTQSVHTLLYEPCGVTAVILPWNSPFGIFSWKLFSNLLVGNPVIVKHAEQCPKTAQLLDSIVQHVGFPDGVHTQIFGDGSVGEALIGQAIDQICFTGSTETGKRILRTIDGRILHVHLELGGSNPAIVFEDADVTKAAARIFSGRFANNGQNCDAIKRLIVHKNVASSLLSALSTMLEEKRMGDPLSESIYFGPLVSEEQKKRAEMQLQDALNKVATKFFTFPVPKGIPGNYFAPVILTNVTADMAVWKEETFAPILPVMTFTTEEEAVTLANDTRFGLGATLFTKDKTKFDRIAEQLHCGNVEMNTVSQWIPQNPFGGYKDSGLGREQGAEGLRELCQIKVISSEK